MARRCHVGWFKVWAVALIAVRRDGRPRLLRMEGVDEAPCRRPMRRGSPGLPHCAT